MMGRILGSFEQTLDAEFSDIGSDDEFTFSGEEVLFIRNAILDACNDTIRSLPSGNGKSDIVIPAQGMKPLRFAELEILDGDDGEVTALCRMWGPAEFIHVMRDQIGRGVVYTNSDTCYYACASLQDNAQFVIPFLDKVRLAGITIASGHYQQWRDEVVGMYMGDIENDAGN
jgi:hypothetical protein